MFFRVLKIVLIVVIVCGVVFAFALWGFVHKLENANNDTRNPDCHIHEQDRISFYYKKKGFDLTRMLDSFKNINRQYRLPDSSSMQNFNDCTCCCIYDDKELYFNNAPKEIYWISIERRPFNIGEDGYVYNDIAHLDIISTYKDGDWHCSLTSKLDSSQKKRIRNRIETEIISKLPMVKDTSAHNDEL